MSNPSRSIRTASYSNDEDKLLCSIYLDIAQDKEKGKDRSGEQLWGLIADEYQRMLPAHINTHRPWRSLQTRFSMIMTAVSKLRGCVRQIENMNPSGASEHDIMDRAKELLMQDKKYKKGFKFDHVWDIVKDMQKFVPTRSSPNVGGRKRTSDGSQTQSDGAEKSIGSCSFNVDLNDDDFETDDPCNEINNVGERPTGRKKEKMKKKLNQDHSQFLSAMHQDTEHFRGIFSQNQEIVQKQYELQVVKAQNAAKKLAMTQEKVALAKEKVALAKEIEDNKILTMDLNLISDPVVRESIRRQQLRIVAKRDQDYGGGVEPSGQFNNYFDNLGGSGDGLGDY